jgi:plastocyanin
MEDQVVTNTENQESPAPDSKKKLPLMALVVLILGMLFVGGGYYFMSNYGWVEESGVNEEVVQEYPADEDGVDEMIVESEDSDEVVEGVGEEVVEINLTGSDFSYIPSEIRVKSGDRVRIVFNVVRGMHDFVIDELNISTEVVTAGNQTLVEFEAPQQPGEYSFYCSVNNHRALGMEGVLIVE